jgi:hypothetical protein
MMRPAPYPAERTERHQRVTVRGGGATLQRDYKLRQREKQGATVGSQFNAVCEKRVKSWC